MMHPMHVTAINRWRPSLSLSQALTASVYLGTWKASAPSQLLSGYHCLHPQAVTRIHHIANGQQPGGDIRVMSTASCTEAASCSPVTNRCINGKSSRPAAQGWAVLSVLTRRPLDVRLPICFCNSGGLPLLPRGTARLVSNTNTTTKGRPAIGALLRARHAVHHM